MVTLYPVAPSQMPAFNEGVSGVRDAAMEQGWTHPWAVDVGVTGPGPTVSVAVLCSDFACLEEPEPTMAEMLAEAYGEDEATSLMEGLQGTFDAYETFIVVRRPDLSVEGTGGM